MNLVGTLIHSFFLGHFARALERVAEARQFLPTVNLPVESWELVSIHGYSALQWLGDSRVAQTDLLEAIRIATNDESPVGASFCNAFLTNTYLMMGQLQDAERCAVAGIQAATRPNGSRLPLAVYPQLLLARICYERNQIDQAIEYLAPLIDSLENATGLTTDPLDTTLTLALIKQQQGDESGALAVVTEAERFFYDAPISDDFRNRLRAIRAHIQLLQGNLDAVRSWADEQQAPDEDQPIRTIHLFVTLTWVRVQLALANFADLHPVLKQCQQCAQSYGLNGYVIECTILEALSHSAQLDTENALIYLQKALTLAASQGYIRLFVDQGEAMQQLLRQAVAHGIAVETVLKLLAAFDGSASEEESAALPQDGNAALIEPLSPRELELLQLIDAGHTNQQIADELIIAIGTVKRHINNIYGKLHAQNRTHALARARELELL